MTKYEDEEDYLASQEYYMREEEAVEKWLEERDSMTWQQTISDSVTS